MVRQSMLRSIDQCSATRRCVLFSALLAAMILLGGCEVDSFLFDQTKTGRFEFYPTTIPVLERIDVIEREDESFTRASSPQPEDLVPRDLEYYIYPGDVITLGIFELYQQNAWTTVTRRVDAGGDYRVPELGDVRAAGLTAQQFEELLKRLLGERVITNPQVDVVLEQSGGLRYTVYGFVEEPGVFNLQNPNLRLLDALALAGNVPVTIERVYVIRQVVLSEQVKPTFERGERSGDAEPRPAEQPPPDVEELIEQLENDRNRENPSVSPGMLRQATQPMLDIDDLIQDPSPDRDQPRSRIQPEPDQGQLEPPGAPGSSEPPPIDVEELRPSTPEDDSEDSYIYVEERGEWVRVPGRADGSRDAATAPAVPERPSMVLDRVIIIEYQKLIRGDSTQNIVIRPNDRIFVESPIQGLVYIGGEIVRPGVYTLPNVGRLTLSRFIDVAGGFPPIAVPERVDLVRVVGKNVEATIRLDVSAIRQRTEPDIYLKPDDHIMVGTNFWATPMAVIRNGFRATYGFGFLLDRNFGTDVFGAPPGGEGF